MQLPEAETIQYKEELRKLEAEPMKYISSIEQMAMAEGIVKGISQGREVERIGLIVRQLERLVGPVNAISREAIEQLNPDQQLQLADDLLGFKTFDDLQTWLALHRVIKTNQQQ